MPKQTRRNRTRPPPQNIYSMRITLRYIEPKIWRGFLVPDNYTLGDLHVVLYRVMGWAGYHMHSFHFGSGFKKTFYSVQEIVSMPISALARVDLLGYRVATLQGRKSCEKTPSGEASPMLHEPLPCSAEPHAPNALRR